MDDRVEEQRREALASLQILDTPREERFDRLVRLTQKMFDVPIAMVSLIDDDRHWNKSEVGLDGAPLEYPRSESMCSHTIQGDAALVVTDPEHDERFRRLAGVTGDPGVRFYAGQPIRARRRARSARRTIAAIRRS